MISKEQLDQILEALIGPNYMAWWTTPNKHWGLKTPDQIWSTHPQEVTKYLVTQLNGDYY